jgi:hypothetical protein
MEDVPGEFGTARRPKLVLPLLALALLLAAWGVSCLGQYRASQLDLSRFGPCEDVCEALGRDGYVAKFLLPYFTAAVLIDGLAVLGLCAAAAAGQFRVVGALVAVLCLPTIAWHGFGWLVSFVLAS